MAPPVRTLTGMEKAAILLVMLGEEATTAVYKSLSGDDLTRLTQQIASLRKCSAGRGGPGAGRIQPA